MTADAPDTADRSLPTPPPESAGAAAVSAPVPALDESTSLADAQPVEAAVVMTQLPFPTVAIGASAGGVEALVHLFGAMPVDSGCAFVVIMHLAPQRESLLAELIRRATPMPVQQIVAPCALQANHVYVIPPDQYLELRGGRLHLEPILRRPPKPMAVDRFMASLAIDQRENAIGIVLSGTDGDGSLGVKAIKGEGGMTMAQLPTEAAYASMPASAIATGFVDQQLALDAMPQALVEYIQHAGLLGADGAGTPGAAGRARREAADESELLLEVLNVLQGQCGLDFIDYKKPMLQRRVYRRMGLSHVKSLRSYVAQLRGDSAEADALAADFLISVTEFFREPGAWKVLAEEVLPVILADKEPGDAVRVWVPACATGEEAYSIAMLLLENPLVAERRLKLQVFATDVDKMALERARKGRYPRTIEQTMAPERLRQFFHREGETCQVRKSLRETVTFAPQNLVTDPPFSRMDLVSCRNLLIYMEPELQRRVLQMFHFALLPDRFLALGKSETIGNLAAQFHAISAQSRIYQRVGVGRTPHVLLQSLPGSSRAQVLPQRASEVLQNPTMDYSKIVRQALSVQRSNTAVLADREGQILYFHGVMQPYLAQPDGAPTQDLFSMVNDLLRPQLRAAIHKALTGQQAVETVARPAVGDEGNDEGEGSESHAVHMLVTPMPQAGGNGLVLISFAQLERDKAASHQLSEAETSALRSLEDQLRTTKRDLRSAIEELEATNEELKVANEEAMSTNEELQSTNEELETSKEELQSVNEELTTVNHQLQAKLDELEALNDDLNNLLASTNIPTLFLDRQFNIKRFTPAATRLFSLIPGDLNRPLTDIASLADMHQLLDDARQVLSDLRPVERETATARGEHYLRRTLPYRTQDDRIDGVVVTFTDISELVAADETLRRFAVVMKRSNDAIVVHDLHGKVLAWNKGAEALYGYAEHEVLQRSILSLLPPPAQQAYASELARVQAGDSHRYVEAKRRRRDGSPLDVSANMSLIADAMGQPSAIALIERDITHIKQAEHELRRSEQRFRTLADNAPVLIWMSRPDGTLDFANREMCGFTGLSAQQLGTRRLIDLLHHEDAAKAAAALARLGSGQGHGTNTNDSRFVHDLRVRARDGGYRWMKVSALLQPDSSSPEAQRGAVHTSVPSLMASALPASLAHPGRIIGSMIDIDAQVGAQQSLREAARHKDEFLAMLGHELRNPLVPIRNAAEVLKRVAGEDSRLSWVHEVMVRQVGHVTRLVDDLLDISLITRGTLQLRLEPVDLRFAIERAVDAVEALMARRRLRFDCRMPEQPVWVEGDPIRLTQIFSNLLTNAAKYSDEDGAIELSLVVEGGEDGHGGPGAQDGGGGTAVVRLHDQGLGISPEMQPRIFDLFVQDQRSVDRSQGGLGIGLALVRHLITLHHGTVGVQSEGKGQGSTFHVRLPLLENTRQPQPAEAPAESAGTGGRVMIVDDDPEGGDSLAMVLSLYGYQTERAVDLESALRIAREFRPQAVIMDIALPGASGYEVAERLRAMPELPPGMAIIGLSGFGQQGDFQRSTAAGFAHHMVKPADPAELHEALQEALQAASQAASQAGHGSADDAPR